MKLIEEIIQQIKTEAGNSEYIFLDAKVKNDFFTVSAEKPKRVSENNRAMPANKLTDYFNMTFEQMQNEVKSCKRCTLCSSRTNVVFGEGNPKAELMFIGEGPGKDEDEQGRPFVGKSGQLLTKMINAMGYQREEVYIANIVKCRPPNNRNPLPDEAEVCLPFLLRQIEIVKPKLIILLGAVPLKYLLNKTGITRLHGEWCEFNNIKTLPTFHPAFLLRDPRQKKFAWEDLQKAMQFLGKSVNCSV